jgi:two-component system chemotaxis sensor kinase CheA
MANKGEVIKVRDKVYHFVRLYDFFEITPSSEKPEDGIVILVDTEKGKLGLLVDEIIGKQEVVIKNLGSFFKKYDYISGSAIMGDGSISLILDVNKFERA